MVGIDQHPTFAVVTNNDYGIGVHSWHTDKREAIVTARCVGGIAVPVHYDEQGELIVPPLAKIYRDRFISHIVGAT